MNLAAKTRLLAASVGAVAAVISVTASAPAHAQGKAQFFPELVYRTGPYAPNGVPFADGYSDYLKLVDARASSRGRGASSASTRSRDSGSQRGCSADSFTEMPGRRGSASLPAVRPIFATAPA